ncbi:MAG: hypothetical protein ACK2TX_12860 [Anaerolineales bacterium]
MSAQTKVLRRPGTMGWLVLAHGQLEMDIESTAVQRLVEIVDPGRTMLLLEMDSETSDDFPLWLAELTNQEVVRFAARPGNVDEIRTSWIDAGLIFAQGGSPSAWREFISTDLFRGYPEEILGERSVLIAVGSVAGALGTWMLPSRDSELVPGLGWLDGGLVLPGRSRPSAGPATMELLESAVPCYALGIPEGVMLALGPAGEVELWSNVSPAIVLGRAWMTSQA